MEPAPPSPAASPEEVVSPAEAATRAIEQERARSAERAVARAAGRVGDAARTTPAVRWRDSVSHGTPNAGWLEDGVQLPVEGAGFYTYNPATQRYPEAPDRRWGNDELVRELIDLGRWWQRRHPSGPRLGIGDLSRPGGGPFLGPVVGHASHQNGLDVDIRLVRTDEAEAAADPSTYDRELTQQLVDRLVERGAVLVLVGPSLDLHGPPGVVVTWPNHDDHLHVRFSPATG